MARHPTATGHGFSPLGFPSGTSPPRFVAFPPPVTAPVSTFISPAGSSGSGLSSRMTLAITAVAAGKHRHSRNVTQGLRRGQARGSEHRPEPPEVPSQLSSQPPPPAPSQPASQPLDWPPPEVDASAAGKQAQRYCYARSEGRGQARGSETDRNRKSAQVLRASRHSGTVTQGL